MNSLAPSLWLDLIGKPYVHLARGPGCFDCYGLVLEIYRRRELEIENVTYEDTLESRDATIAEKIKLSWKPCEIKPGAVLVFGKHNMATHCGVAIDVDRFIHASADHKTTLVSKLSRGMPPFRNLLLGSYEHVSAV